MSNNTRPFQQGGAPTQEQLEAFGKLAKMLQQARGEGQAYTPIMKSLDAIHVEYKIIDVMLNDEPVECVVIPMKDLMYREWAHMSGQGTKSQGEEQ
jgi:hypothetical protein